MPLDVDDGYTLPFETLPLVTDPVSGVVIARDLPTVSGKYRPALFEEIQRYRYALSHAEGGSAQAEVIAKFVAEHVVSWDVRNKGAAVAVESRVIREKFPEPIVSQLLTLVLTWAPRHQGEAEKN